MRWITESRLFFAVFALTILSIACSNRKKYIITFVDKAGGKDQITVETSDSNYAYLRAVSAKKVSETRASIKLAYDTFSIMNEDGRIMKYPDSTMIAIKSKIYANVAQDTGSTSTSRSTATGFLALVKENKNIVDADITSVGFLYISVVNDGVDKKPMANFYCRLAASNSVSSVKAVKIVDAATAHLLKNGTAYGTELAVSFCN